MQTPFRPRSWGVVKLYIQLGRATKVLRKESKFPPPFNFKIQLGRSTRVLRTINSRDGDDGGGDDDEDDDDDV